MTSNLPAGMTLNTPTKTSPSSGSLPAGMTSVSDPRDTMVSHQQQQQQNPPSSIGNFVSNPANMSQSPFKPGNSTPTDPNNPNSPNYNQPSTSTAGNFMSSLIPAAGQVANNVGSDIKDQLSQAGQGFMQGGEDLNQSGDLAIRGDQLGSAEKFGEGALRGFASAVQGLFSPVTATLQEAVKGSGEAGADILGAKGGDVLNQAATNFDNSPGGQKVNGVIQKIQQKVSDFIQKNPGKVQAIQDAFTTIATVLGEPEVKAQTSDLAGEINTGIDTVKQGGSDLISSVKDKINTMGEESQARTAAKTAETQAANNQTASDLTGKIIQGKTGDLEAGQHSLLNVDASKVNSLSDLSAELQKNIETNSAKLDEALSSDKTTHQLSEFDSKTQVGGKTITSNPVKDAITQLSDLYEKTNDVQGQKDMAELEQKANTEGLTSKELNDLAREHSQAFDQFKANANGEYASGLNKQAARNTYTGLKNAARGLFGDEAARDMDSELSDDLNTKKLVDQQIEKQNTANQKIPAKGGLGGLINKVSESKIGGAARDVANLHFGSAAGKLMPSGELSLNDMLTKLQNTVSDGGIRDDITSRLQQVIDENNAKPEPTPKGEMTTSTARASDLGQKPMSSTIKVNDYRSQFPKYFTPDQIDKATEMLNAQQQAGYTIDMKTINTVVRKVKNMDIKIVPKIGK